MYHVYKFLDSDNKVLYVGYTANLQIRIGEQHFAKKTYLPKEKIDKVNTVEQIGFKNMEDAQCHERYYIDLYKPSYNKTTYEDHAIINSVVESNWSFYCSVSNGKITKCDTENTCEIRRAGLIVPKDLKKQLEDIAKEKNRSFNNLVITVLMDYVEGIR